MLGIRADALFNGAAPGVRFIYGSKIAPMGSQSDLSRPWWWTTRLIGDLLWLSCLIADGGLVDER